jgi:adhesin/invasin
LLGACGDNKLGPNVAASIGAAAGDNQTILAGNHASAPITAVVHNSAGTALPNVEVRWRVLSGGGSLQTVVDTTDASGNASTVYYSPAPAGTVKVEALSGSATHDFTMTIVADTIGTLIAYGGNNAAALVGNPLTLTARATDRFGNPIKGVDVSWTTSSGQLQAASGTTDSTGKTTNVITVGPDTGKVSIVATSRFNAVTFTVSSLATP